MERRFSTKKKSLLLYAGVAAAAGVTAAYRIHKARDDIYTAVENIGLSEQSVSRAGQLAATLPKKLYH